MISVNLTTTLVYHDGPLLSEGRDPIGGHYLVMSVSDDAHGGRFVVAGISPDKLRSFKNGSIDLLEAFAERGIAEWFIGRPGNNNDALILVPQDMPLDESGLLPKPGFQLREAPINDTSLSEA